MEDATRLWAALDGDTDVARSLAQDLGGVFDGSWSSVDMVLQNRRFFAGAAVPQVRAKLDRLEAVVAATWKVAIDHFDISQPGRHSAAWRALKLLTERFPSKPIHEELLNAICTADCQLRDGLAGQREPARAALAPILVGTWHKTLDRASMTGMTRALAQWELYANSDAFTGWIWSWRFGMDRAVDYLRALDEAYRLGSLRLGASEHFRLKLKLSESSESDLEYFQRLIKRSIRSGDDHPNQMYLTQICETLYKSSNCFSDWSDWLDGILIDTQLRENFGKKAEEPPHEPNPYLNKLDEFDLESDWEDTDSGNLVVAAS